MNISDINLINYDLNVLAYSETLDASQIPANQYTLKFGGIANPDMEQLIKDMTVMNAVRGNTTPAVQDAFEQLLTLLALSK